MPLAWFLVMSLPLTAHQSTFLLWWPTMLSWQLQLWSRSLCGSGCNGRMRWGTRPKALIGLVLMCPLIFWEQTSRGILIRTRTSDMFYRQHLSFTLEALISHCNIKKRGVEQIFEPIAFETIRHHQFRWQYGTSCHRIGVEIPPSLSKPSSHTRFAQCRVMDIICPCSRQGSWQFRTPMSS